jgi:hypothetical protein
MPKIAGDLLITLSTGQPDAVRGISRRRPRCGHYERAFLTLR